jgi:uncharacterized protein YdaU (DUF1376 family)
MSKDPAVLFYTSDFLTGTLFFTMEQKGQYITLLCIQHQHGSIPENHMISICGSFDNPVISKFTKDEQGNYYNERMKIEAEKRKSFCLSRSNNKSGRPKKNKKSNHKKIICKSYDNHMENENDNEDIIKDRNEYSKDFEKFWTAYPNKKDKIAAFKSWKKINIPLETILTAIQKQIKWRENANGEFRPEWKNPATWLNKGSWDDELKTNNTTITQPKPVTESKFTICGKCGAEVLKTDFIDGLCPKCPEQKAIAKDRMAKIMGSMNLKSMGV